MEAPFDETGSLCHYAGERYGGQKPTMKEVGEFYAYLQLNGLIRGRSAAYFMWSDVQHSGVEYPMFLKDLEDLMVLGCIINGRIIGTFKVKKRGSNYGIAYVSEQEKKKAKG